MSLHTVTIAVVFGSASFAAGQTVGPITATLNAPTPVVVNLDGNTGVFPGVADGSYTITVQATDGDGAALGAPFTTPVFAVTDPGVVINVPTGATVTIS